MSKKKLLNIIWVAGFLLFLAVNGVWNRSLFSDSVKKLFFERKSNSTIEERRIAGAVGNRMDYVNINGLGARVLGQRVLNEVILDQDGMMYLISDMNDELDVDGQIAAAEAVDKIYDLAGALNAEFLYVQSPIKYPQGELPYGYRNTSDPALERFRVGYCRERGEACLDLREALGPELEFYRTDHHWTVETAWHAARCIEQALGHPTDAYDPEKYEKLTWPGCFLGSAGIRTGAFFAGADDITFIIPRYETGFHYEHYIASELELEKDGDFSAAFLNYDILDDSAYYNKYDAALNGSWVETRIVNHLAPNDKKALVIADSYGRSMVMYTALNYCETRYLDPQKGRFNDNYLAYMEAYRPDVVIVMAWAPINVGG